MDDKIYESIRTYINKQEGNLLPYNRRPINVEVMMELEKSPFYIISNHFSDKNLINKC